MGTLYELYTKHGASMKAIWQAAGNETSPMFAGFPDPARVGAADAEMHLLSVQLHILQSWLKASQGTPLFYNHELHDLVRSERISAHLAALGALQSRDPGERDRLEQEFEELRQTLALKQRELQSTAQINRF